MMIEPPIDEMVKKVGGSKFLLSVLIATRAKQLEKTMPDVIESSDLKAISLAAEEVYNGEIVPDLSAVNIKNA